MGARVVWDHEVAGSIPVTPTNSTDLIWLKDKKNMRVSYIGNTPAFQAGKVGSIPTTRSIFKVLETSSTRKWEMSTRAYMV